MTMCHNGSYKDVCAYIYVHVQAGYWYHIKVFLLGRLFYNDFFPGSSKNNKKCTDWLIFKQLSSGCKISKINNYLVAAVITNNIR